MRISNKIRDTVIPYIIFSFIITLYSAEVIGGSEPARNLSDKEITKIIKKEFLLDSPVPFNTIDVKTQNGIVTLDGTVTNLLSKERAEFISETVRGVRSVINRIQINPDVNHTPDWIREAVIKALAYDPATEAFELGVKTDKKGQVTLTGTVDSWQKRKLAADVSKSVSGVRGINNKITVKPLNDRSDKDIRREIENRLQWDATLDASLVSVEVKQGNVFLSGIVGSAAEKRQAGLNARVTGVKNVDLTSIKIETWANNQNRRDKKNVKKSDSDIRTAVKDSLRYDPRLTDKNITVEVDNGVVTLRGTVDNARAKIAAGHDSENTIGVADVKNLLIINRKTDYKDDVIAESVRNALSRNPYTEKYEINVKVENKTVYLTGTVDSTFEKNKANSIALNAKGVIDVKNNLEINFPG